MCVCVCVGVCLGVRGGVLVGRALRQQGAMRGTRNNGLQVGSAGLEAVREILRAGAGATQAG